MPSFNSAFPKIWLDASDERFVDKTIAITVDCVKPVRAFMQRGDSGVQMNPDWGLYTHEHHKPVKLTKPLWREVAACLGLALEEDTSAWEGEKLYLKSVERQSWTNTIRVWTCLKERPPLRKRPQTDRPAEVLDTRPIPEANIARYRETLAKFGKNWDSLLVWMKKKHPECFAAVYGRALDDIPVGVASVMKAYTDFLAEAAEEATPALPAGALSIAINAPRADAKDEPETVDRQTGEVRRRAPQELVDHEELSGYDDIPF